MVLLGFLLLWAVLLFQSPFVCCCFPSPPLGGTTFPLSSVWWCCLVHSSLGWCCVPPLGGVAFPISFQVVLPSFASFWWDCLPSPPLGGAVFSHLLKGGAAWFLPFLGGLSFVVLLPSFPSFRCGAAFLSSLQLGPALSPPPLGGVAFPISFQVVLPSFPSSEWDYVPLLFGWVVLLGFFLLRMVLTFFFTCLVVLPSFPSLWEVVLVSSLLLGGAAWSLASVGGVAISLSFGVVLPSFPSSVPPLFCWVVLLGLLLLWVVLRFSSPLAWCCLLSPPAFPLSSVGWCCLVSCCDSPLLCRRAALLPVLWVLAAFTPLFFCVVLLCFPFLQGVVLFSPPVGWCCFSKTKKKRCNVKGNLKTVAKWKNENGRMKKMKKMRKMRKMRKNEKMERNEKMKQ